MLTRSDGTKLKRLSVSVSSEPEKMLLNPRATTLDCTMPPLVMSMPGTLRSCSDGVVVTTSLMLC